MKTFSSCYCAYGMHTVMPPECHNYGNTANLIHTIISYILSCPNISTKNFYT